MPKESPRPAKVSIVAFAHHRLLLPEKTLPPDLRTVTPHPMECLVLSKDPQAKANLHSGARVLGKNRRHEQLVKHLRAPVLDVAFAPFAHVIRVR
jgi:hypothetical protein